MYILGNQGMYMKYIKISKKNKFFVKWMKKAVAGLKPGKEKLLAQAKNEFNDANISLFYNKESKKIRVLQKDSPPIDFPISDFE